MVNRWGAVLAALYLPGTPHKVALNRRRWLAVASALRISQCDLHDSAAVLRSKGHFNEASALENEACLAFGVEAVETGQVMTTVDDGYPERWLAVLAESAPPALWKKVARPIEPGPWFAMVGSRNIDPGVQRFCADVARQAIGLGLGVVSGGAIGCDAASADAALRAGGRVAVLLPYGLGLLEEDAADLYLSLAARNEPFSPARAMERNALIYAAASHSFIGHARLREGGTWTGATDAIRRRLTQTLVREDASNPAHRALVALGAFELKAPEDLAVAMDREPAQGSLFQKTSNQET